jgi:ATP-binding cassette subfamily B protein
MKPFPFFKQLDQMDCGSTCLRMICKFYGKIYTAEFLRDISFANREGTSFSGLSDGAESIGLKSYSAKLSFEKLKDSLFPCIVHWKRKHFVVVYRIDKRCVFVADPAFGLIKYGHEEFCKEWSYDASKIDKTGSALFLEPSAVFYQTTDTVGNVDLTFFYNYLKPYSKYFFQIFLGLLLTSGLQLIIPFLTQSIVDVGINNQDIGFINLILIAQVMLFFSRTMIEFVRSWLFLHIGTRINITIVSDFLIKLMKLPISFFETKTIGDLMQRIGDHRRVQEFISGATLNTVFSFINLIIFSIVLSLYSLKILLIFFLGSSLYVFWVVLFMRKRKELDYKFFQQNAVNQNVLIQLISGMRDIKLHNSERRKRWEWEESQAHLFKINTSNLKMSQFQLGGSSFINEVKNILITITSAKLVIDGEITLGMMLSIQYVIGQLNVPVSQLIGFLNLYQDAKTSMERMNEIHNKENEQVNHETLSILPENKGLRIDDVSFQYPGNSTMVLKNVSITIPEGKVTAIVGASGSGKTSLLKVLLKFYAPSSGKISMGGVDIQRIDNTKWRDHCGAVLQDGYIFSDTILRNIALNDEIANFEKVLEAAKIANISEFIESLPLSYNTRIGNDGHGLSQGQRQRILIARAVYKEPNLIIFDEPTSSLDTSNESRIMQNLNSNFQNRTVIIAAHRLSTIINAEQIVVIDNGQIVEVGNHKTLLAKKEKYFSLVRSQLT